MLYNCICSCQKQFSCFPRKRFLFYQIRMVLFDLRQHIILRTSSKLYSIKKIKYTCNLFVVQVMFEIFFEHIQYTSYYSPIYSIYKYNQFSFNLLSDNMIQCSYNSIIYGKLKTADRLTKGLTRALKKNIIYTLTLRFAATNARCCAIVRVLDVNVVAPALKIRLHVARRKSNVAVK